MAEENLEGGGPGKPPGETPRIHVDSGWKREAQAEKERLAREIEAEAARPREAGPAGAGGVAASAPAARPGIAGADAAQGGSGEPASFGALVEMLATQAAISMSDQHDPETGQPLQNLDAAKHFIDLLGVLEAKTKGNLTDEESRLLDTLLYELRMAYVNAAS